MKKLILGIAVIVVLLFVIDQTLLQDKENHSQKKEEQKYETTNNPEQKPVGLEIGNQAPSFTLKDVEGNTVSLEDYRGKKILLNFWATWCDPCKDEMPYMDEYYNQHKDQNVVVLGINSTNTEIRKENAIQFVDKYNLTFPILFDEKGHATSEYEVLTYPTSYFIDSDGIIRNKVLGQLKKQFMIDEVKKLP